MTCMKSIECSPEKTTFVLFLLAHNDFDTADDFDFIARIRFLMGDFEENLCPEF